MTYLEMKETADITNIPEKAQLTATEIIELINLGKKNPDELFDIITTVHTCGYIVGSSKKVINHE